MASIIALTASSQTTNQPARSLSLKDCVDMALAHNLQIQIGRYDPEIWRRRLGASYGSYDPALTLSASRTFTDQPPQFNEKKYFPPEGTDFNDLLALGNISSQNAIKLQRVNSEFELTVDSVGPGIAGRLPSGLSYNLFARSDHLDDKTFPSVLDQQVVHEAAAASPLGIFPPLQPVLTNDYYATVGITLKQPLLKDFWIDSYRARIQLSKVNLKISEQKLRDVIMTSITTVTTVYYNLVFAREQISLDKTSLQLAQQLLDETHRKVQAGTATSLDEKLAESDVESIKAILFGAEQTYTEHENALKNLLTDNYQRWMDVPLMPSEDLTVPDLPANRGVSWMNALSKRPDIVGMRLALETNNIRMRFEYNQLYPSLDLVGSYGWQSVQPGFSGTLNDIRNGSNPFYSVGVIFSFPLGNVTARNDYEAAKLHKQQALVAFKELEQKIIVEVDTAVKAAETALKQIGATRKAAEYAKDALEVQQTMYANGTTTSFYVLEYQRNLSRARFSAIRALADYNIALAELALRDGTTLEKHQIDLKFK